MSSKDSSEFWEVESPSLDAKEVYVVMQNDYRISRNIRAQWFFKNVNNTLTFKWKTCQEQCLSEIEIISAIPKCSEKFEVDTNNSSTIRIVSDTKLHFLSTQYRLVFCLDLSSSVSTVDIQHDDIYYEEIFSSLDQSLKKVSEPFFVPGSEYYFMPQIYVTVIAHIPNCATATPQVLIQGWVLTHSNVQTLLDCLQKRLQQMCKVVKQVSSSIHEDQIHFMMPHNAAGSILDGTIDGNKMIKKVLDLSADTSTLKLIRYGILALQLLPENSSAGIVVITDGILNFPNCKSLDSLLTQLRNSTIACSFLQLGSPFHSFSCFGRAPYKELMEFIATATCGAYFPSCKYFVIRNPINNKMNAYHKALLIWNFQKTSISCFLEAYEPSSNKENYWHVDNPHFYTVAHQSRVKKKHTEGTLKVSLENLLSCRLREGYSVKSLLFDEGKNATVIRLVLPWMLSTNIEYLITSGPGRQWKNNNSDIPSCHFEVIVDGCYEFLHDVTCSDKKPIRSAYRKTVIAQFWSYIKNLSNTDQILTQLHSFALNPVYYTIPESIKNGVPLFYFPSISAMPMLSSKNLANVQFTSFWKPLCMLDINVWQKWMHAHRIGVILQHDIPLQKNLHLPNLSGRYVHVQCRQAIAALNSLLTEDCSFVLVENHSYIKLLFEDPDKPPVSFYVIRVTSKPPCVVIRLAFLGGLPGLQRFKIVNELREKILKLKLPKQSASKDYSQSSSKKLNSSDLHCCLILRKPVEKILIRYEKLPTNFLISVPDSQGNTRNIPLYHKNPDSYLYTDALATLSKYLLQQRWIWTLQYESYVSLDLKSASKILYAITNIRLQEGFHFSHSSFGIIYLVQEIPVKVPIEKSSTSDCIEENESNCCIVQYIIFPPHTNTTVKDSISEEDDTEVTEADGELQLITECWVEPQHGFTTVPHKLDYLNGLQFDELPKAIHNKDLEIVKVLTTFEHLCTVCQRTKLSGPIIAAHSGHENIGGAPSMIPSPSVVPNTSKAEQIDAINTFIIPYAFNLMSLLPKCPQVEMIFSTLHEIQNDQIERESIGNNMFFEYFMENMKHFHDHEIILTMEDCAVFLHQVHHRECKETKNPALCFPHPEFTFSTLPLRQTSLVDFSKCIYCSDLNSKCQFMDTSSELSNAVTESIPRWRCFVKGCSSSHVLLTLVPASYNDLKKLYYSKISTSQEMPCDKSLNNLTSGDASNNGNVLPHAAINEHIEADNSLQENIEENVSVNENAEDDYDVFNNENIEANVNDKKSIALPVYVYNCVSTSIINQLVQLQKYIEIDDTFEDHTYECECCFQKNINDSSELLGMPSKKTAESAEAQKKTVDLILLKEYCSLLEKAFSKAYVYGVYRSLMMGLNVQKFDAIAAIDNICEESLLEVDITEFVFMICGHVKDFFTKQSFRQMHHSHENNDEKKEFSENPEGKHILENLPEKCFFPMSMLQKYQPCEELHQKHLNIKKKFSEIIESFFKTICSRPDYYYFCPINYEAEDMSLNEGDYSQEEDALSESVAPFEGENFDTEVDKGSNFCEEDASSKSFFNTNSSVSSIDKDTEHSSLQDKSTYPPLLVHFSCSVKSKQSIKSCPLISLPTCLNDIIKCLDTDSNEINLEEIRITLDIYCLTVPNDVENPEILKHRINSTSFSSNSPIPEAEMYRKHIIKDEENDSNCSDTTDVLQGGNLINLPSFQREAVHLCLEKVKWLLQDEKASVALNCFPTTSNTLDMVVEHVKSSSDKPCCLIKEISLMFVYGSENSLDKFTQAFKRMSPIGYRLEQVGDRYFLVTDTDAEPKCNLEASLEISQFDILKNIPHSDDGTELKRVIEEIKDMPVFSSTDFPFLRKDTDKLEDTRESEVEHEVFSLVRDKRVQTLPPDEDSETEDGFQDRPKAKFRKSSVKRTGGRGQLKGIWETERKSKTKSKIADKASVSKKNLGYSRSISTGDEKDKQDYSLKEGNLYSEVLATATVDESSADASLETKFQHVEPDTPSVSKKASDSDDPTSIHKDSDYEKFHCTSNTEDGYDGDSSDCGSDLDLINSLEHTRRPVLPKFWLIMNICDDKVIVYFHMRHRAEDDPEIMQCKTILNEVVQIVNKICKEVNQILLLKSLCDTRMCDRLLVPEENEDLWKNNDPNRITSNEDPDCTVEVQEKYLEATLKFDPGAFGCPVVWVTHFKLHHRLAGSAAGSHKSCGMQALRSVLNTFSVNNRENMFVYQESSGKVFYIRLFEMHCDIDHQRNDDDLSLTDRYSSMQSLPVKNAFSEFEYEADFRPRVNSGASDGYRQDSISTTSSTRKNQKCVGMYVHGIGDVGSDIRNDLVQVLQNRLNEGVLDQINMMLARNPLCMLTPEDVLFIQNANSCPVHELYYTLPVKLLGYAHAIHIYLRQNLLHFLYNPKYTDSRKETHFKAYWRNSMEWSQVDDNDAFLYHSQQALGRPGGKGISCVVLCLVTGQNKPFQTLDNLPPNPSAYLDGLSESEFDDLTCTSAYTLKNDRSPGPVALVRFQLWHVGKDNIETIERNLKNAVKYALWDLLLEYRALTSPTSDSSTTDDPPCYSEPTTPIRVRRSGIVNIESNAQSKEQHSSIKFQSLKEMSSSVPDITSNTHSSSPILKDIPSFKDYNKPQSAKPEFISQSTSHNQFPTSPISQCDKRNLNLMFDSPMKRFLQYGEKIGIPTLHLTVLKLPTRHSTDIILKEGIKIIKSTLRDLVPKLYMRKMDSLSGEVEYVPYDPYETIKSAKSDDIQPGATRNFIIIGRNEIQWRAFMGLYDFAKFQEKCMDGIKSYQRYLHHVCDHRSSESYSESTPSSPTFVNKSTSSITSTSPNPKSSNTCTPDNKSSSSPSFVPRQRLLLMYIEDREVVMYLYNFTLDTTQTTFSNFTRLIKWHHNRTSLLSNIILQKIGVFHGLSSLHRPDCEMLNEELKDLKSGIVKEPDDEPGPATFGYVEQLIRYHSFVNKDPHNSNTAAKSTTVCLKSARVIRSLKNFRPPIRLHLSCGGTMKDPVSAHGLQFLETITSHRKDMQVLYNVWQTRGSSIIYPFDRVFHELKRLARLSHYCWTPILFSPSWRYKVAPIRDHALEPFELNDRPIERLTELTTSNRSRHSSGGSLKSGDAVVTVGNVPRTRRMSGAAGYPGSNQGSPKLRSKTPSEETWHTTVCHHYLQEYITYLHTVGFVSLQTSETAEKRRSVAVVNDEERLTRSDSFSRHRTSVRGAQTHYLIKCLLGGLIVFELGMSDPYAFGNVYSLECMRFRGCSPRKLSNQFTPAFLDELDKIKRNMNLHSFTYDYHLRMIHSYVSGRQLIFKNGYHITSFLDDFIKYYQKVPSGARNAVFATVLHMEDVNMFGNQLYNYIISHNKLYSMGVLRMVPIVDNHMDTEYALVELSAQKASYKDVNDLCQIGSFDVGILINQNVADTSGGPNALHLNYYIILTSQRDLYPKLSNFGTHFGSFRPVINNSSTSTSEHNSRKTSAVSMTIEKEKLESSGEESIHSVQSIDSRTKKVSVVRGMCAEDVFYYGYYSSQETMMETVLQQQANSVRDHLFDVVKTASVHCRRDSLWSSLLPRTLKEENSSRDYSLTASPSPGEFATLLNLVSIVPLNEIDEKLAPFMNMHISWYTTLVPVLKSKYADCHREFLNTDNNCLYVIVTSSSCPDSFMLLTIDAKNSRAELCVVFREEPKDLEHTEEKPNQRVLALQSLVEGFVNACCFHLWTCILPS